MGLYQDSREKLRVLKTFSATGIIGTYPCLMEMKARIEVNGVGVGNVVSVEAHILNSPVWNVLTTITGVSTGVVVDISVYDEIRFNVTTYSASGEPQIIVAGFLP